MGDLLVEYNERSSSSVEPPVLTLTERNGFVPQASRFKKRLATDDTSNYKVVRRYDVAFNPYLLWAGAVAQNTIVDAGIISPLYPTFRVRDGFDPRYVARLLLSPGMIAAYDGIAFGSVPRRRRSSVPDFLALGVPAPPKQTQQRRIADILDRTDALRAKRREALVLLDDLTQSIFLDMFGDPVANPKAWSRVELGERIIMQQYGPRFYNEAYASDGIRIVRITDLDHWGNLDFDAMPRMTVAESQRRKFQLAADDIVFARTGATVGKLALIRESDPACIAGAYFIRMKFREDVVPEYAAALLRTRSIQSLIWAGSHQSAQQNFSGPGLRALPLPVPPLSAQQRFAECRAAVANRQQGHSRSANSMDELFASLQQRAFAGEL